MRLEDSDEDIMIQGSDYEPTNDSNDVDLETEVDDSAMQAGPNNKPTANKMVLVVGGVIVFMLVGALGFVMMTHQQKKKEAEVLARLEEEDENTFSYSQDEIEDLRENGYTGDEIEEFELNEIPAQRKIDDAVQKRKAKYDEEILPYLDGASDKYKELEEYTWLGGAPFSYDVNKENEDWYYKNMTLNLDYDKVPARGVQCFLRLHLKEKTDENDPLYMFMTVTPQRYEELPEHGNIVVYIEYTVTDQGTVVTRIDEQRVADK